MILIKLVCDSPKLVVTAAEILFFLVQGQPGIFTHTLMEKVAVWVAGRREVASLPRWDNQLIAKSKKEKFVRMCVELSCTGPYILTFEFYFSLAWLLGDFSIGELQWIDRVEELQKNSFWADKET